MSPDLGCMIIYTFSHSSYIVIKLRECEKALKILLSRLLTKHNERMIPKISILIPYLKYRFLLSF